MRKSLNLDKIIIEKYVAGQSTIEISRELKISAVTVWNYLVKNNIPRRSNSENLKGNHHTLGKHWYLSEESIIRISNAKKGNKNPMHGIHICGEDHWNWKGGITSLTTQIRRSDKYKKWRIQVFERDLYTCQCCGIRGVWFEVHHKKRFKDIIKENDIKTLDNATQCNVLWDISNGITLCKQCHDKKRNKYE